MDCSISLRALRVWILRASPFLHRTERRVWILRASPIMHRTVRRVWILRALLILHRTGRRGYSVGEKERARRANETAEQKEHRLRQRRERDRARCATQVTEEREARLLQLSTSQREREARLQCDRQRHREQVVVQSQLSLFQQHSVRSKMLRFHAHMASLDSPQCTTCSESYPGLRLGSQSTVCQRCTQDKHTHSPSSSRCSTNGG